MASKYSVFAIALAALIGDATAFWRMNCANIMIGRLDPLVNPNAVSAHVHTVQGSSNFGVNSTGATLANADCSSCEIQDDKSAYWSPLLYYEFANGTFMDVPQSGSVVYYLGRGTNATNAVPFPPGFRMIAGDAGARAYNNVTMTYSRSNPAGGRPISDAANWACLSTSGTRETPGFNSTDCNAGLRGQIHFQSCWNGVDLYKSDQSHVAHMSGIDNGDCPPTHPIQLPHLFIETSYTVSLVPKETGGRFVLSTGDPTGYSFHADFINGWNQTTLGRATKACLYNNPSYGTIDECSILGESQIANYGNRCPVKNSTVLETVKGTNLTKIPGCISIVNGPGRAVAANTTCPSSVTPPLIVPTTDSAPLNIAKPIVGQAFGLNGWQYVGCSNDSASSRALSAVQYNNATGMTVEVCQAYCASKNYKYAGLEIGNQCFCDSYVLNNPVYNNGTFNQGKCYYQCVGNNLEYCGGQARIDIYTNSAVTQLPLPKVQATSGKYVHKGCYVEPSGRALRNYSTSTTTMTPDFCAKTCLSKKYKWFGLEYGSECYCGDRLINATAAASTDCKMTCSGNAGQTQAICGGPSRLDVYFSSTL